MRLIHLDRTGRLHEGDTLELFDDYGIDTFTNIANTYPSGISEHGHRYGFGTEPQTAIELCNSKAIEWLFEGIRLSSYPAALSRLQAVFAVSESDVSRMVGQYGFTSSVACFEVVSSHIEKRDMALLTGDIASAFMNANKYWQGLCSEYLLYEYLMKPPVKIVRKLTLSDFLPKV